MPGSLYQYRPEVVYQPDNPYSDASDQVLRQVLRASKIQDPELMDELEKRQYSKVAAFALGLADQGLNATETGLGMASSGLAKVKKAPRLASKLGAGATKLARINGATNVITNLAQGALTTASGTDAYGSGGQAPWWTAAVDLADSSPLLTGPAYPVMQMAFGGAGSHSIISNNAKQIDSTLRSGPSEQFLYGRTSPDWDRNKISSILTGQLIDRINATGSAWDDAYRYMKRSGATEDELARARKAAGTMWADYNRAQDDHNWIQKSWTSLRDIFSDTSAIPEFLQAGHDAAQLDEYRRKRYGVVDKGFGSKGGNPDEKMPPKEYIYVDKPPQKKTKTLFKRD